MYEYMSTPGNTATYRQYKVARSGWERTYNAFVSTLLSQRIYKNLNLPNLKYFLC